MNRDTVCLLKECNSGCKCATNSMEQVMPFLKDKADLRELIHHYNDRHIKIGDECHALLNSVDLDEKDPPSIVKAMSWFSTEIKLLMDDTTERVAGLMVDGCSMGIKSLSGYLNQYKEASEDCRKLTRKLIDLEQEFMQDLLKFV